MHNHKSGRKLQSRRCLHTTVIYWHPPGPKLKFTLQWVIDSISLEAWNMKNSLQSADCFLSFWTSVLFCSHDRFYYFFGQLERNSTQKAIHCAQFSPHSFHWWGNDCQIGGHVLHNYWALIRGDIFVIPQTHVRIQREILLISPCLQYIFGSFSLPFKS